MAVINSLLEKFPELAKEWDYEKNILKPDEVSYGSHKKVYWRCPICGQSYLSRISNRTSPSRNKTTNKCPICLGRIIIPNFNSLKAKFPIIIENEWDYNKNKIDPNTIAPHTNKLYWWKCSQGHSYQASPNNKINNKGGDCPYCSHQKLSVENSLSYVNPELSREWDYEKNLNTPSDVFANSNEYAWWKCSKCGHIWKAKINNRNNGRGCPECSKGRSTSFPEQAIFHFIKELFPDAINRHKHKKFEIDIYIPSIRIGIEYDGEYYHNTKEKINKDIEKNICLHNDNITLIRVREEKCYPMNNHYSINFTYKYNPDYSELNTIIKHVIDYICDRIKVTNDITINIKSIRNKILEDISKIAEGEDLETKNPELVMDWDYKKNYPLTPKMFLPNSEKKVFWKCSKCGYEWEARISSRNKGYGCHRCANRERYTTKTYIEKAKTIHGSTYDYSKVNYTNAHTPIVIICKKHGEFTQTPAEHLSGKGCKYCSGKYYHKDEVLSVVYPELVKEWDYEKNLYEFGITPETAFIHKKTKYYWLCNYGKQHSYLASIQDRIKRNMKCCICHGKQHSEDYSVGALYPELIKEWSPDNEKTPYEVTPGSEYLALWKCSNPNHEPYRQTVYNRCKLKTQCPYCSGNKKHPKDYEQDVINKFPNITIITPFVNSKTRIKCRCKICGNIWEPYPYKLLESKGCPKCKNSTSSTET